MICKKKYKSHLATTLIELLIVIAITAIIFGAILGFLIMSKGSWEIGKDKLIEQQQARKAMADIVSTLRYSNPNWDVNGTTYPLVIGTSRIDFYMPAFYPNCCPDDCAEPSLCLDAEGNTHSANEIAKLTKITYKLNPDDPNQLLKKEGTNAQEVVATEIASLDFTCGCSGCSAVDSSCPIVEISITTQKITQYNLRSKATLRNQGINLADDVEVEEPQGGEF